MANLLRWPKDAIMIVASRDGKEIRSEMAGVHEGECRHCRCKIVADTRTVQAARDLPADLRGGRPTLFFCWECHLLYDSGRVPVVADHRPVERRPDPDSPAAV